jgi:hypothetical protein
VPVAVARLASGIVLFSHNKETTTREGTRDANAAVVRADGVGGWPRPHRCGWLAGRIDEPLETQQSTAAAFYGIKNKNGVFIPSFWLLMVVVVFDLLLLP